MSLAVIESVLNDWWYYSVELKPGVVTKGICPTDLPMLPRVLTRAAGLRGMSCLDVGAMEGLMSVLMLRQGASRVLAIDAVPHCERKMAAVKEAYGVDFAFRQVGLMYGLSAKLRDEGGFDFINFSGVNYHVFSPMHCIAGLRPLLKKNGLMVIGTNVMKRGDYTLEFNHRGRLQREANTFWYHSVPLMEYLARYFLLKPIDCLYFPHSAVNPATYVPGLDIGYLVIVCRAVEEHEVRDGDQWARRSRAQSWEFRGLCDSAMMNSQPRSEIRYESPRISVPPPGGIDLLSTVERPEHIIPAAADLKDSHVLMLDHDS